MSNKRNYNIGLADNHSIGVILSDVDGLPAKRDKFQSLYASGGTIETEINRCQPISYERDVKGNNLDPAAWAFEAAFILQNSLILGNAVKQDFRNEVFDKDDVVTFKEPTFSAHSDTEFSMSDIQVQSAILDSHLFATLFIEDSVLRYDTFSNIVNTYINPAMSCIARCVDLIVCETIHKTCHTPMEFLKVRKDFDTADCVLGRKLLVSPNVEMALARRHKHYRGSQLFGFDTIRESTAAKSIAFIKDAVVLANRPLPNPLAFTGLRGAVESYGNVAVRCQMGYNICEQGIDVSLDTLFASHVLEPEFVRQVL